MDKKRNLRLCYLTAHDCGDDRHAQLIMKELGITYRRAEPQTIADQWLFWDCDNVPDDLPRFITDIA